MEVMKCIKCKGDTKVTDSRTVAKNACRRRRICVKCGFRYTTIEKLEKQKNMKICKEEGCSESMEGRPPQAKTCLNIECMKKSRKRQREAREQQKKIKQEK